MLRAVSGLRRLHYSSFSSTQKYCSQTPVRNAIYAHAQDFVVHELLLPIHHLYYPPWKSVCSSRTDCNY